MKRWGPPQLEKERPRRSLFFRGINPREGCTAKKWAAGGSRSIRGRGKKRGPTSLICTHKFGSRNYGEKMEPRGGKKRGKS